MEATNRSMQTNVNPLNALFGGFNETNDQILETHTIALKTFKDGFIALDTQFSSYTNAFLQIVTRVKVLEENIDQLETSKKNSEEALNQKIESLENYLESVTKENKLLESDLTKFAEESTETNLTATNHEFTHVNNCFNLIESLPENDALFIKLLESFSENGVLSLSEKTPQVRFAELLQMVKDFKDVEQLKKVQDLKVALETSSLALDKLIARHNGHSHSFQMYNDYTRNTYTCQSTASYINVPKSTLVKEPVVTPPIVTQQATPSPTVAAAVHVISGQKCKIQ